MYARFTGDLLAWQQAQQLCNNAARLFGLRSHQYKRANFIATQRYLALMFPQFN